jgi:S-phase kinase-associated protein 1
MTTDINVNLVSSDGVSFSVPVRVANLSQFISVMTSEHFPDEYESDNDEKMEDIPVLRVRSQMLDLIVGFMNHYDIDPMVTIKKPLVSNNIGDIVQHWYAVFIEHLSEDMLFDLVNAANYMHIQPLLELACAGVAISINDKTTADIAQQFYLQLST